MQRPGNSISLLVFLAVLTVCYTAMMGCTSQEEPILIESTDAGPITDTEPSEPDRPPSADPEVIYDFEPGDPQDCTGPRVPKTTPPFDSEGCPLSFRDQGQARLLVFSTKLADQQELTAQSFEQHFRDRIAGIADCFSDSRPNIVVFPEYAGLQAAFADSRAADARQHTDLAEMLNALADGYEDTINWLYAEFGALQPSQAILLALTHTVWNNIHDTFSGLADDYDTWIVTGGFAPEIDTSTDPDTITAWAGPDHEQDLDSVYIPDGPDIYNSAFVFNPQGELTDRVHKVFLSDWEQQLGFTPGNIEDIRPVELGSTRAGVVLGHDAWMPPVNDRYAQLGAELLVQLEASERWAGDPERWPADIALQSGWLTVQKSSSYRYGAIAPLTGRFSDRVFDGQPAIWGQTHRDVQNGAFIGQCRRPGILDVGPWVIDDPGSLDPALSLTTRREQLRDLGDQLSANEDTSTAPSLTDTVVGRDLSERLSYTSPDDTSLPEPIAKSKLIKATHSSDEDGYYMSRRPRIDSHHRLLLVGWHDDGSEALTSVGPSSRRNARLSWNSFTDEYEQSGGGSSSRGNHHSVIGDVVQLDDDQSVVTYTVVNDESTFPWASTNESSGTSSQTTTHPLNLPGTDHEVWGFTFGGADELRTFSYTTADTGHDRVVSITISRDDGYFTPYDEDITGSADVAPPDPRGHQWHPAADRLGDTTVVVWTDYRNGRWQLFGTFSTDAGDSWSSPQPLTLDDKAFLETDPQVSLIDEQQAVVSWTHHPVDRPDTDARYRRWDLNDGSGDIHLLDSPPEQFATHAWLPIAKPAGDELVAAWVELRDQVPAIRLRLPGHDDPLTVSTPGFPAWSPDLTITNDHAVITWVEHRPDSGYSVRLAYTEL